MAMNTFKHQTVYDPRLGHMRPLTAFRPSAPPAEYHFMETATTSMEERDVTSLRGLAYLGELLPAPISVGIATGWLHPITLQPLAWSSQEESEVGGEGGSDKWQSLRMERLAARESPIVECDDGATDAAPSISKRKLECVYGSAQQLPGGSAVSSRGVIPSGPPGQGMSRRAREMSTPRVKPVCPPPPPLPTPPPDRRPSDYLSLPLETLQRRKRRMQCLDRGEGEEGLCAREGWGGTGGFTGKRGKEPLPPSTASDLEVQFFPFR